MRTVYYKTSTLIEAIGLPFYFGCVHIDDNTLTGRHYKPKLGKLTETHIIGYYEVNGNPDNFLQILQEQEDREISQEEFETLLAQWEQASKGRAVSWGPGQVWEVGQSVVAV